MNFKLARPVLKSASFEFASLKCFKGNYRLTFVNLKNARLLLNAKCKIVVFTLIVSNLSICDKQNRVQAVAFIYVLTSNEEISKTDKGYR